jgi:hypothetical protein
VGRISRRWDVTAHQAHLEDCQAMPELVLATALRLAVYGILDLGPPRDDDAAGE